MSPKTKTINETVKKINEKHGEEAVITAKEIISENVKTPTEKSGADSNYYTGNVHACKNSIAQNNKICKVRDLKEDEIECKISSVKDGKGISLLLYKTARTDMSMLDETFGQMNWQCEYKEIKGNMYCGISVFDEIKKEWITKWDCGVESAFGDKQKGEASDAFKRAGFKWGIGIELYTAPFIWIPSDKCEIRNGKCYDKFILEKIATENKTIIGISIKNITLKDKPRVFVWQLNK
jgi:hypothetical protein